jgi:hypothetical protein
MQNAFLRDFMKMRSSLHTVQEKSKAVPTNRAENLTNITLATIIEKKLPTKDVLEYFRKRTEELEEERELKEKK